MKETIDGVPVSLVIEGDGMGDLSGLEEICRHNNRVIWLTVRDGRRVVLKGLAEAVRHHPEEILSLRKEYLLTLRMDVEGVVRVYGFEDNPTLGPLILMEYVDGTRLDTYIESIKKDKKSRSLKERKEIARRLAETIGYIHKAGVCHRDLKPDNVILRARDKMPVIIDFGHSDADDFVMYKRSLGTYEYGAPEQRTPTTGSVSSDVYSYGKILEGLLPEERFKFIIDECTKENPAERPDTEWVIRQLARSDRNKYKYLAGIIILISALCALYLWYDNQYNMTPQEEINEESVSVIESNERTSDSVDEESSVRVEKINKSVEKNSEQILQKYIDEADKINARYGRIGYELEDKDINDALRMQRGDEHYKLANRMEQELERAGVEKSARSNMSNDLWTHIIMETNRIDGVDEVRERIMNER